MLSTGGVNGGPKAGGCAVEMRVLRKLAKEESLMSEQRSVCVKTGIEDTSVVGDC